VGGDVGDGVGGPAGNGSLWYYGGMKKATVHAQRETMVVPVVSVEEVAVPTEKERSDLLVSLKQAEAEAAAGKAKPFNRATFKERFLAICRGEIA
jgi:hypothetical protein